MKKKTHIIKARVSEEDYLYIKGLAEGSKRFPESNPNMSKVIRQLIKYYQRS